MYPNGVVDGNGTHLSLYVAIARGEYDDQLKWPFNGVVTIEMFNWKTKKWEFTRRISLDDRVPIHGRGRAVDCITGGVQGHSRWTSLAELAVKHGGVVRFKVTKVELK